MPRWFWFCGQRLCQGLEGTVGVGFDWAPAYDLLPDLWSKYTLYPPKSVIASCSRPALRAVFLRLRGFAFWGGLSSCREFFKTNISFCMFFFRSSVATGDSGAKPSVAVSSLSGERYGISRSSGIQGTEGAQVLTEHPPKALWELGVLQGRFLSKVTAAESGLLGSPGLRVAGSRDAPRVSPPSSRQQDQQSLQHVPPALGAAQGAWRCSGLTNKLVGAAPHSMKAAGERTVAETKPQCFSQNCNFPQKLFQELCKIKKNLDSWGFFVVDLEEVCLPFQHRLLLHAAAQYPLCRVGVSLGFTSSVKNT